MRPIILLSGGFDPYHDGHANMFRAAGEIGDICVILNSDEWLKKKKGQNFMSLTQRADVLSSVKNVIWVWESTSLNDVGQDIATIVRQKLFDGRLLIFAKGGDRNASNTPEQDICEKLGIPVLFGLGGNNNQSSSKLLAKWGDKCEKHDFNLNEIELGRLDG